ncbi:MAG: porin family protein [Bacteroidales bacterium]|jgi:hypothetical protein|nr:porin family protein [Bacteroidales bacterium]MDD3755133.1 porin family protein [Bacteroidales bacterium]MDY0401481.1 porin family protein [Bacteroidales bacterium]HOB78093.1 porin family protein [Bacteroidales bacterium]HPZ60573.1 porin family protein [Bacteroidales bacterium]
MKKTSIIVLLFLFLFRAHAQNESMMNLVTFDMRPVHFGFILGFNSLSFSAKLKPNDTILTAVPIPQSGFEIGITADLNLASHLNLRFIPGLSFGSRKVKFTVRQPDGTIETITKSAESTFLDFPLYLKYKTDRLTNFRAYALLGAQYSLDLASQSKKKEDKLDLLKINPHNINLLIGGGGEFYLRYFKFGIEIRMTYGLNDVITRRGTVFDKNMDYLKSKIFWIVFTFE